MSASSKRKVKPKATKKAAAKPRALKKRAAPARKPAERAETPSQVAPARPPKKELPAEKSFLLALRLKGSFGTPASLEKALSTLRLKKRFNAVLLENKGNVIGMLRGVKDYVTWGEIRTPEIAKLLRNRGKLEGGITITDDSVKKTFGEDSVNSLAQGLTEGRVTLNLLWTKGLQPVFRLRPPSGGFETSAKRPRGNRGELGARGTELPKLLDRML
jgi:large subunit ribosomal protein L30